MIEKEAKKKLCPISKDFCFAWECCVWVDDITMKKDNAGNYTNTLLPVSERDGHCGFINNYQE